MQQPISMTDKLQKAANDSGSYFSNMARFVGFNRKQADAVFESRFIIEKQIPDIVAQFYDHLLRYPPTRKFFLNQEGDLMIDYVKFRMQHLGVFWRRTATGPYDEEYARYIDYVGRAHTKRGADPNIDIAERYVIGQVGFVQHAISNALSTELHEIDPEWEIRAVKAWNLLMMVILEMLARVYHEEDIFDPEPPATPVDSQMVKDLSVQAYERGLGMMRYGEIQQSFFVANEDDIPLGERKIVSLMGYSFGIFHQKSGWYALINKCLHAGGPVAEGRLRGDTIICPRHGYRYNLTTGQLQDDPNVKLQMFAVEVLEGQVFVRLPVISEIVNSAAEILITDDEDHMEEEKSVQLSKNEFWRSEIPNGGVKVVELEDENIAIFNVDGEFFALEDFCTHAGAPLSEGTIKGKTVVCSWHGSCFNLTNGEVTCGPADEAARTYKITFEGEKGTVN